MLTSYLKTALRHFWRQKAYSFINVVGLAVGLVCSFFILLWVDNEMQVNRFHEDGDQLYRVMRNAHLGGNIYTWMAIPQPLEAVLDEQIPEIEQTILVTWQQNMLLSTGDVAFRERGWNTSDDLFEAFTYPLLVGDPATVLKEPESIVISERVAQKLFGDDWRSTAIGQRITVDLRSDATITGVFENIPEKSTYQFDFVRPIDEFVEQNQWLLHWGNNSLRMFVKLQPGADLAAVNQKIENLIVENNQGATAYLFLQGYEDMHLYSNFREGNLVGGRIDYVRTFGIVALFILLIACINFMNLATARSAQRAREIGVRKAIGATRRSMIGQFLGESVFISLVALVLAVGLVAVLLPVFNELTGKTVAFTALATRYGMLFLMIALGTGVLAGSYPALYLASFDVAEVLKGTMKARPGASRFRQVLVVFQFAMSILLIIGTMTVYEQIDFIRTKNLGLERDNLVYVTLEGGIEEQFDAFRQQLAQQPGIKSITTSSQNPLSVGNSTSDPSWDGKDPEDNTLFHIINANYAFTETMQMRMVAGRTFSREFATDSVGYVINQEAARAMGMEDPIGQSLDFWGDEGHIIGMVEDFHFDTFYTPIEPLIIRLDPEETWLLFVRTEAGRTEEAIAGLETVYKRFNPSFPFEYTFLDDQFERFYRSELLLGKLASVFAIMAVFISCLGLFGLASFMAEQRTKEIGIRKVLGASVGGIVVLLSQDFTKLVLAAFVLASPLAYYGMTRWLSAFEYRIEIGVGVFVLAGIVSLFIAWFTVSYQSFRAAVANPVQSLRAE